MYSFLVFLCEKRGGNAEKRRRKLYSNIFEGSKVPFSAKSINTFSRCGSQISVLEGQFKTSDTVRYASLFNCLFALQARYGHSPLGPEVTK